MPPAVTLCPDRDTLHRLLLGELVGSLAEELAAHLEQCDRCTGVASALRSDDSLVALVRTPPPALGSRAAGVLQNLIGRLQNLGPPPATPPLAASHENTVSEAPAKRDRVAEPDSDKYEFLTPPLQADELGRLGGYRVLRVLGSGGMGIVFQAEDIRLGRTVALKVMRPALSGEEDARQRFLREARLAATLEHEHVVTIYQVGEERSVPFLAMQWLRGMTLEELLDRRSPLAVPLVLRLGRQIATGLAAAHGRGLIHRDVKPANLWLEEHSTNASAGTSSKAARSYRVKILDFGLARAIEDDAHLTQSGVMVGTPAYMAPEQFDGREVDHRCDLYSLGTVLYRACTGQLPYPGKNARAVLAAQVAGQRRPVRELNSAVTQELAELIEQLLAKEPADRPASAIEVADRLLAIEQGTRSASGQSPPQSQPPAPASPRSTVGRPWRRRSIIAAVALVALFPSGYFVGGVVVHYATNRGQVVIAVDDPDTEVTLKEGNAVILDRKGQRTVTLTAGQHELEVMVKDSSGEVHFPFTKTIVLTRGGLEIINIREELAHTGSVQKNAPAANSNAPTGVAGDGERRMTEQAPARGLIEAKLPTPGPSATHAAPVTTADSERRAAEWVLSIGAKLTVRVENANIDIQAAADLPAKAFRVVGINLDAGNPPVQDADLAHLEALTDLESLRFGNAPTDAGVVHLKGLTRLKELVFHFSPLSDAGLAQIANSLQNLEVLAPRYTRVTDAGLTSLKALKKLRCLYLDGSRVTDAGMAHLGALTQLEELSLNKNRIGDDGLEQLKGLTKLKYLTLEQTTVGNDGLASLEAMAELRTLGLFGTRVTDAGLAHLEPLRELVGLGLEETAVTDAGLEHLKGLPRLTGLDLRYTRVAGLAHLKGMRQINYLILNNSRVDDAGLETVGSLTQLHHVSLVQTRVRDAGLIHLNKLKYLGWMELDGTQIGDAGLKNLEPLWGSLDRLSLNNTKVTDAGLEHVGKLPRLQSLSLANTGITDAGLTQLRGLIALRDLRLTDTKVTSAGVAELRMALPACHIEAAAK
jgi:eukaryotic-like serine/threonine-protein kinase